VALAPGIAALVGIGATALWQARLGLAGRITAGAAIVATALWAYVLLDRTPTWLPWLRWVIVIAGVAAAAAVLAAPYLRGRRALVLVPVGLAMVAGLAGPAAYALDTVNSTHTGAIPSAGPETVGFGGGGPGGTGRFGGGRGGQFGRGNGTGTGAGGANGAPGTPGGTAPGGSGSAGTRPGGTSGANGVPGGAAGFGGTGTGRGTGAGRGFGGGAGFGGGGGLGGSTAVSSALKELIEQNASSYKWVAATEGSEGAAPLQLATGDAVMAIGGFNGTDPWPTLAAFKALVAKHEIHYYVGQGSESFGGGQGSSAIAKWVAANFKSQTVGGETVYNLTEPTS
jgi:hypothetical protein